MHWPEDLIVGGIERDSNGFIRHAEGFQTVFLVASAGDVQHRISVEFFCRFLRKLFF